MPEQKLKIEMKSGLKLFQPHARTTVDIKISNTNGKSSDGEEHKKTFDYLLLIEPGLAGVISYDRLKPFIRSVGDGFSAKIDTSEIELLSRISNYKVTDVNLSNLFDKMIDSSIQEIGNFYNE